MDDSEFAGDKRRTANIEEWHRWCDPAPWWNLKARLYPWRRFMHRGVESGWKYHTEEQHAHWCLEQEFGPRPDAADAAQQASPTYYHADTDMEMKKR